MAQEKDEYRIITSFPAGSPTQYRVPLMQYMNTKGFIYTSLITGWGTTLNQPFKTVMILIFTTVKNQLSEAEALQIGQDVIAILDADAQLISVQKTAINQLN